MTRRRSPSQSGAAKRLKRANNRLGSCFPAKHPLRCPKCHGSIQPGEYVTRHPGIEGKKGRVGHVNCPSKPDDPYAISDAHAPVKDVRLIPRGAVYPAKQQGWCDTCKGRIRVLSQVTMRNGRLVHYVCPEVIHSPEY